MGDGECCVRSTLLRLFVANAIRPFEPSTPSLRNYYLSLTSPVSYQSRGTLRQCLSRRQAVLPGRRLCRSIELDSHSDLSWIARYPVIRQLLPTSSPLTSLPFAQEADIEVPVAAVPDDPRQLFKPSVLREENLVPLAFPPDHPWESLSIHDKIRPNDQRHNPLPTFPRPISVPAYPEPVLPSSPRPVDHLPTVRYRDLPPETMAELYRARIMARPVKGKDQGWVQKAWDMFDAEVDDPNGWVLVREKMGLPPTRADRPASILFWWENLEEEQLWRWLVPFFWVWALVPIIGTGLLVSFFAYDGAFEDENGFRFGKLGWGVPQPPVRKELA
ncbi:hypothetical protein [Phaffia rhodozyma]|uniref:Transmembrane protein n=1 Tax=Phaffia rhodozyma TaxID=264483 RepID=A0A0F7STF1_PHARH|nr:hypothetical protein [Phaffia rhodozyma]